MQSMPQSIDAIKHVHFVVVKIKNSYRKEVKRSEDIKMDQEQKLEPSLREVEEWNEKIRVKQREILDLRARTLRNENKIADLLESVFSSVHN